MDKKLNYKEEINIMNQSSLKPRKQPKQKRSIETVKKIIQATLKLLEESGLESVTAINVADKAQINIASFYQYFPNKDAVVYAAFQSWVDWIMTRFDFLEKNFYLKEPWELFFYKIGDEVFKEDFISESTAVELLRAMEVFPKLKKMNEKHGNEVAWRIAGFLDGYGSKLSQEELFDISLCIFHSANSLFRNAVEQSPERKLLFMAWGREMIFGLTKKCFENFDGQ